MKTAILVIFAAWLLVGCVTLNEDGDTPREAEVRAWLYEDHYRIAQKIDNIENDFTSGKIDYGQAKILLDRALAEKDTRLERARERFPY